MNPARSRAQYITTTLPYVNAEPHIGFALEIVRADIYARYRKLQGDEVYFNTGTDEHGLKIFQKACDEGKETKAYVDEYAAKFRALKEPLGLSDDLHFIRTTDLHHVAAAQEMWRRCAKAGDIFKKKYKGLYCVGDEMFLKESDLVNGKCPNHPSMDPVDVEEENYFFRLSAYQDKLMAYLSREGIILPEWRRQEALQFVQHGLEDISISREKNRLSWGIPVPGDDSQTIYVWFDALTNYISTLGWPASNAATSENLFEKYWVKGDTLQMAGKDQLRFQSIMWQAMLMSAGLPTTDHIVYNGFITSGGQKMSKSIGNVIDPLSIVEEYGLSACGNAQAGTDALRYFLARHVHPFEDTDVTMGRFKETYNADLANGLGNLVARIMRLAQLYLPTPIQKPNIDGIFPHGHYLDKFEIDSYMERVAEDIKSLDKMITEKEPFKVVKINLSEGQSLIQRHVEGLYLIAYSLTPILPHSSKAIMDAIFENKKPDNLFLRKD